MPKYTPLQTYLANQHFTEVPMSFQDVERVLGTSLPRSAFAHRPWWANETQGHVHAKSWLNAGYETAHVDMEQKKLVFRRIKHDRSSNSPERQHGGMADTAREFNPALPNGEKKQGTSPLWGALKGTFTIEPGYDLTSPMYTDEEWDEIMEAKFAKFDRLYADMEAAKDKTKK